MRLSQSSALLESQLEFAGAVGERSERIRTYAQLQTAYLPAASLAHIILHSYNTGYLSSANNSRNIMSRGDIRVRHKSYLQQSQQTPKHVHLSVVHQSIPSPQQVCKKGPKKPLRSHQNHPGMPRGFNDETYK
jgi:hypothetical protein